MIEISLIIFLLHFICIVLVLISSTPCWSRDVINIIYYVTYIFFTHKLLLTSFYQYCNKTISVIWKSRRYTLRKTNFEYKLTIFIVFINHIEISNNSILAHLEFPQPLLRIFIDLIVIFVEANKFINLYW